jgi:hypothetical protein
MARSIIKIKLQFFIKICNWIKASGALAIAERQLLQCNFYAIKYIVIIDANESSINYAKIESRMFD